MKRAGIVATIFVLTGCGPEPSGGEGGAGGAPAVEDAGKHDACIPLQDNDPVACAPNKCATTSNGCGGVLRCDTVCTSMNTPASCGMAPNNEPECFACARTSLADGICKNPDRPYAYTCRWQYPQPGACEPKNFNADTGMYTACCGGPA